MERQYPFFSVIIPTYNRPEQLAACLAALSLQEYPADRFEVIVVDGAAPDPGPGKLDTAQFRKCQMLFSETHPDACQQPNKRVFRVTAATGLLP